MALDTWAPETGPDAGKVIVNGRAMSPADAREAAHRLETLADFAEQTAEEAEPTR